MITFLISYYAIMFVGSLLLSSIYPGNLYGDHIEEEEISWLKKILFALTDPITIPAALIFAGFKYVKGKFK